MWREKGEEGGGAGGREGFAKMPSHGSLQQAVKVRPGRGEKEETSLGFYIYSSFELTTFFASYLWRESRCLISICLEYI